MKNRWTAGNRLELLENGEAYYPRVFEAIAAAEREVLIETFILFDDKVGQALRSVLIDAAGRGVAVQLTVDSWGSPDLSEEFVGGLTAAGVRLHYFDHRPKLLGMRLHMFRRMHRKIVVVDGRTAFVGGINFSADHLGDFGPEAKQDYAVRIEGPLVDRIHRFAHEQLQDCTQAGDCTVEGAGAVAAGRAPGTRRPVGWRRWRAWRELLQQADPPPLPAAGDAQALFVTRDNHQHRTDIERHYRVAIRAARKRIVVANAYFFPGYRLLREMRRAAKRGVEVHLILQGKADMAIVPVAAGLLYQYLLNAGVTIHEYCRRPLHGKVAVIDGEWATVGSSNLDPLSLSLNLEANVIVRDRDFADVLGQRLQVLIDHDCRCVSRDAASAKPSAWRGLVTAVAFHVARHFPAWLGGLPAARPKLTSVPPPG